MKKRFFPFVLFAVFVFSLTSCVSTKKIVYFQGTDSVYSQAQAIAQQYAMRIKPADNIMVKVTCSEPDLLKVFAQDVTMGSTGTMSSSVGAGSINNIYGYTVDNEGYVVLPALGKIKIAGSTTEECAKLLEEKIKSSNLIYDPQVTVRFMNARVTVVGAVKSPGLVDLGSERNTVIDVLAKVGDVDDAGLKQNVKLFREENGLRRMYVLDLTKADIFTNPAFYVQQNDMIYVEPNKSKSIKSSAFYTYLTAGTSILGVLSTIISLIAIAR